MVHISLKVYLAFVPFYLSLCTLTQTQTHTNMTLSIVVCYLLVNGVSVSRYRLIQKLSRLKKIFAKLNFLKLITSFGLSKMFREFVSTGQGTVFPHLKLRGHWDWQPL